MHSATTHGGKGMEHSGKGETSRSSAEQFAFRLMAGQDTADQKQGGLQQKWAGLGYAWPSAVTLSSCKATGISGQVTELNLQLFDFANVFFKV